MKIFMIGPEGAGKTVFATMLNAYVAKHPERGLVSQAADIDTKKYLDTEYYMLEKGEWPISTKGGKMVSLAWRWLANGRTSDVALIDPAGQDIRRELCGESNTLRIIESIKKADLLLLLVDLYGHQRDADEKRTENAWIVEHVLKNMTNGQRLLLGVTKADLLTASLPREKWEDRDSVLDLIREMMPRFNFAGYESRLRGKNCSVLAFSSVAGTEDRDEGGRLIRFPKSPLESEGMDRVVADILDAWVAIIKRKRIERFTKISKTVLLRVGVVSLPIAVGILAYCLARYAYWWIVSTRSLIMGRVFMFVFILLLLLSVGAYVAYFCRNRARLSRQQN